MNKNGYREKIDYEYKNWTISPGENTKHWNISPNWLNPDNKDYWDLVNKSPQFSTIAKAKKWIDNYGE